MDLRSEGGHDDPSAFTRLPNLRLNREAPRGMWCWEFAALLQKYRHPQWWNIGIESTIYGNNPRAEAGIDPCGTVWVAKAGVHYSDGQWLSDHEEPREWIFAIPRGYIPYNSILTARFNEDSARWEGGDLKRGWRPALEHLVKGRYLRNDPYLTYLIGVDNL